jgi:hypothetical protein
MGQVKGNTAQRGGYLSSRSTYAPDTPTMANQEPDDSMSPEDHFETIRDAHAKLGEMLDDTDPGDMDSDRWNELHDGVSSLSGSVFNRWWATMSPDQQQRYVDELERQARESDLEQQRRDKGAAIQAKVDADFAKTGRDPTRPGRL